MKKNILLSLLTLTLLPINGCAKTKICTIWFDPNNGEEVTYSIQVKQGEIIDESSLEIEALKNGYEFVCWTNNNIKWSFKYDTVKDDMTLKAKYKVVTYQATYDLNGASTMTYPPSSYTIEDNKVLQSVERDCYDFLGWFDEEGNQVTALGNGMFGDIHLTAKWALKDKMMYFGKRRTEVLCDVKIIEELEKLDADENGNKTYNGVSYYTFVFKNEESYTCELRIRSLVYFLAPGETKNLYFENRGLLWHIVSEDEESYTLLSHYVFPQRYCYDDGHSWDGIPYDVSPIREWINSDEFMDSIFTSEDKAKILVTEVDNGPSMSVTEGDPKRTCPNTFDKLYIPSEKDVYDLDISIRKTYVSDYDRMIGESFAYLTALRNKPTFEQYTLCLSSDGIVCGHYDSWEYDYRPMMRISK